MLGASFVLREITGAFDLRRGAVLNIWRFNSCRSHLDNSGPGESRTTIREIWAQAECLTAKGSNFPP